MKKTAPRDGNGDGNLRGRSKCLESRRKEYKPLGHHSSMRNQPREPAGRNHMAKLSEYKGYWVDHTLQEFRKEDGVRQKSAVIPFGNTLGRALPREMAIDADSYRLSSARRGGGQSGKARED